MNENLSALNFEKAFGIKVLLKLTRNFVKDIKISTSGNKISSNVSSNTLNDAVDKTIQRHGIRVKTE